MRVSRLLCLVLLSYVTLDVASPVVPGVFQLVDGAIRIIHADRARPVTDSAMPSAALPTWFAVIADRTPRPTQQPRPRRLAPRRLSLPRRRPPSPGRALDRSEDH
jgi:hypothetical protein